MGSRPTRLRWCSTGLAGGALSLLSGCLAMAGRHWDETRRTVIDRRITIREDTGLVDPPHRSP
jgi:hypothetical protein